MKKVIGQEEDNTLKVLKKHFPYIYTKTDLTTVFVSGIGVGIVLGIVFFRLLFQHQNFVRNSNHQHSTVRGLVHMY